MLGGDMVANVLGGGDGVAVTFVDRLAAGVDAGSVTGAGNGLGPCKQVSGLFGKEAATFFLIEKEHRAGREMLALSRRDGGVSIILTKGGGADVRSLGLQDFVVEPSIEKHKKSKSLCQENIALALPGIASLAGWIVQPVSGERKVAAKSGESFVTGVIISVEAEVAGSGIGRLIASR